MQYHALHLQHYAFLEKDKKGRIWSFLRKMGDNALILFSTLQNKM